MGMEKGKHEDLVAIWQHHKSVFRVDSDVMYPIILDFLDGFISAVRTS
jgi:hypothetical protein